MKTRITSLFIFICILLTLLILRTGYLQFLPQEKLNSLQYRQFQTVVNLPARRGSILDNQGKELAMSIPAFSVYADPKMITSKREFIKIISSLLEISPNELKRKIKDTGKRFVWLERLVTPDIVQKIKDRNLRGIGFVEEWRRVYPNDQVLSNTIGFVGKDGVGLEGLEHLYDEQLRGQNRKVTVRRDARGRPLIQDGLVFTETPQGQEIKLTIDSDLQYFVESELDAVIKEFEAIGGYAVVLDAKTSAIRAISSLPQYDLNNPQLAKSASRRNKSVSDTFEPGSTMKTFVVAEALESNLYKPNSKIFCENGAFQIGRRTIKEAEKEHAQGLITITEVMQYSSNIGTAKIALKLSDTKVREALMKFGFGERTGVDLPGEAKGILLKTPWRDHLLANISFGQGVTATPLQVANAYASIANGGLLNQPYIVESITDFDENKTLETKPKLIRRVLSEKTADDMRMILTAVTSEKGTGIAARVPGFIVGGKTGTAQKVNPIGRGYLKGGYISSFAGFVPANNPQYVIFVAIDQPKKVFYGSQVAAPLFSKIASFKLRHSGIASEILAENDISLVPQSQSIENQETKKVYQSTINSKSTFGEAQAANVDLKLMPKLDNMNFRDVLEKANQQQLKVKFVGQTFPLYNLRVQSTSPRQGEPLDGDRNVTVFLDNRIQ
jgi:cell division protein FtsI (penicillin-binding protein 3)